MAQTFGMKALFPAANTDTSLYVNSTSNGAVISSFVFCNQTIASPKVRFAIVPPGEVLADKHYDCYEFELLDRKYGPFVSTTGYVVPPGGSVYVRTDTTGVSFKMYYSEVDN